MTFFLDNFVGIFSILGAGIVLTAVLKHLTKDSSYSRVLFFFHLGFVTLTGWGLIVASATFNWIYTYSLLSGMPGYENLATVGSVFAVFVNLAGGVMLQAAAKSFSKGKKPKAFGYVLGYLPIVSYSLLAANSVLLTGDANTRHKSNVDAAYQTSLKSRIGAIQSDNSALLSSGNSAAMKDVPTTMRNSNGVRVSVSGHCSPGNWYAKNQPACQQYLAAKSSNANASTVSANNHAVADLEGKIASSMAGTKVPLQSAFFGLSVPPSIATLALALAIELAAIGCLVYAVLDIGLPPALPSKNKKPKPKKKQSDSRFDGAKERFDNESGSSRFDGSPSVSAASSSVNEGSLKSDKKTTNRTNEKYYEGGTLAANKVFGGAKVDKITRSQLDGFLYEIAKANPHKPAVANQVIKEIRHQTGCGISKLVVLDAIKESDEFILTDNKGGSNSYIFKVVNDEETNADNLVQTVQAAQRAGPRRQA